MLHAIGNQCFSANGIDKEVSIISVPDFREVFQDPFLHNCLKIFEVILGAKVPVEWGKPSDIGAFKQC